MQAPPIPTSAGHHHGDDAGAGKAGRGRDLAIDALRGLAMIIMALDHARDLIHDGAMVRSPEDLATTTTALFFTRWITHFCAPVFMFTAGLGVFLQLERGRSRQELSRFLISRGVWLIGLEVTIFRVATNPGYLSPPLFLTVLWALGLSMIVLASLIHLPFRAVAGLSIATIVLHNLLDSINANSFGPLAWIWNVLHQPGVFIAGGVPVLLAYPLIPWFAVMAAGYCSGAVMRLNAEERIRWMLHVGAGLTLLFIVIRWLNVYGDPVPWSAASGRTVLSFLRSSKYPPSLDFILMTIGPALLLLAWFQGKHFNDKNPLIVFGRVPLFYFVLHWWVIRACLTFLSLLTYGSAGFLWLPVPSMGGPAALYPKDFGWPLPVVYAVWIFVVAAMYPLCRWFMNLKARRRDWWLSYL